MNDVGARRWNRMCQMLTTSASTTNQLTRKRLAMLVPPERQWAALTFEERVAVMFLHDGQPVKHHLPEAVLEFKRQLKARADMCEQDGLVNVANLLKTDLDLFTRPCNGRELVQWFKKPFTEEQPEREQSTKKQLECNQSPGKPLKRKRTTKKQSKRKRTTNEPSKHEQSTKKQLKLKRALMNDEQPERERFIDEVLASLKATMVHINNNPPRACRQRIFHADVQRLLPDGSWDLTPEQTFVMYMYAWYTLDYPSFACDATWPGACCTGVGESPRPKRSGIKIPWKTKWQVKTRARHFCSLVEDVLPMMRQAAHRAKMQFEMQIFQNPLVDKPAFRYGSSWKKKLGPPWIVTPESALTIGTIESNVASKLVYDCPEEIIADICNMLRQEADTLAAYQFDSHRIVQLEKKRYVRWLQSLTADVRDQCIRIYRDANTTTRAKLSRAEAEKAMDSFNATWKAKRRVFCKYFQRVVVKHRLAHTYLFEDVRKRLDYAEYSLERINALLKEAHDDEKLNVWRDNWTNIWMGPSSTWSPFAFAYRTAVKSMYTRMCREDTFSYVVSAKDPFCEPMLYGTSMMKVPTDLFKLRATLPTGEHLLKLCKKKGWITTTVARQCLAGLIIILPRKKDNFVPMIIVDIADSIIEVIECGRFSPTVLTETTHLALSDFKRAFLYNYHAHLDSGELNTYSFDDTLRLKQCNIKRRLESSPEDERGAVKVSKQN